MFQHEVVELIETGSGLSSHQSIPIPVARKSWTGKKSILEIELEIVNHFFQGRINHKADWAKCPGPIRRPLTSNKVKNEVKMRERGPIKHKMKAIDP